MRSNLDESGAHTDAGERRRYACIKSMINWVNQRGKTAICTWRGAISQLALQVTLYAVLLLNIMRCEGQFSPLKTDSFLYHSKAGSLHTSLILASVVHVRVLYEHVPDTQTGGGYSPLRLTAVTNDQTLVCATVQQQIYSGSGPYYFLKQPILSSRLTTETTHWPAQCMKRSRA